MASRAAQSALFVGAKAFEVAGAGAGGASSRSSRLGGGAVELFVGLAEGASPSASLSASKEKAGFSSATGSSIHERTLTADDGSLAVVVVEEEEAADEDGSDFFAAGTPW